MLYSQYKEYKKLFSILKKKSTIENGEEIGNLPIKDIKDLQVSRLDNTANKLRSQSMAISTLHKLLKREKKRFNTVKKHFETELLCQTPLEQEVKLCMRNYLRTVCQKKLGQEHQSDLSPDNELYQDNSEFYRLGLTKRERKTLIELLLKNEKVSQLIKDKLIVTEEQVKFTDSDIEELGDDFKGK